VGAALALVVRLLLVGPADLYARMLGSAVRQPPAGSLQRWLESPLADEQFLRHFVLATWWVGILVGVGLVWKRAGRWSDLAFGAVAGAFAGLAGAATLGCALAVLDALPRAVLD